MTEDSRQAGALDIKITLEDVRVLEKAYYLHGFGHCENDPEAIREFLSKLLLEWLRSPQGTLAIGQMH